MSEPFITTDTSSRSWSAETGKATTRLAELFRDQNGESWESACGRAERVRDLLATAGGPPSNLALSLQALVETLERGFHDQVPTVLSSFALRHGREGFPMIHQTFRPGATGWENIAPRIATLDRLRALHSEGVQAVALHWPSDPETVYCDFRLVELGRDLS